jgi:hypothetical protein
MPQDKIIQMPDGKVVSFPAGMPDDAISAVLRGSNKPAAPPQGVPVGQISAGNQPTTLGGKVEQAWKDIQGDIKYGNTRTPVGSFLKAIGAQPTENGVAPGAADMLSSPYMGVAKASEGVGQVMQPGKRLQGAGNIGKGAVQAATIPASFIAPEAAPEAASATGAMLQKVPVLGRAFASAERAGKSFQNINEAIGKTPFEFTPEIKSAAEAMVREKQLGGGNMPAAARALVNRINDGSQLTFEEGRRMASNLSRMSASDWFQTLGNGNMRRLLGETHGVFNEAVQAAADSAGVGKQFAQAMNEYRQAKQNAALLKSAVGAGLFGSAYKKGKALLSGL